MGKNWVAALAAFLTPFMGSAVNIALPAIDREFSAGALMLNWIATLYLLSAAVFLLPVGKASDILGRKKFFLGGVALFTLASVLSGMATSLLQYSHRGKEDGHWALMWQRSTWVYL